VFKYSQAYYLVFQYGLVVMIFSKDSRDSYCALLLEDLFPYSYETDL